ncbi:MAG: hypothetical protein IJR87_11565 [Bacteroidaceae bacterium]|nr:hypothetical protein [Bacteroidaceae bacterium]
MVARYLNAETTLEEEQMLRQYYAQTDDVLTPEESDVRLLILSSANSPGEFALSDKKADEFDRLMEKKPARRVFLYWVASTAAVVVIAFFLLTSRQTADAPGQPQVLAGQAVSDTPTPTITPQQVSELMSAVNFANEQVETYRLKPVGDATVVTKTLSDGTSASYIVCQSDDNEGLHVVPINIEM